MYNGIYATNEKGELGLDALLWKHTRGIWCWHTVLLSEKKCLKRPERKPTPGSFILYKRHSYLERFHNLHTVRELSVPRTQGPAVNNKNVLNNKHHLT